MHGRHPKPFQGPFLLADLKAAMRQLVRFHCRLSHVAAHTAISTIALNDVIQSPDQVVNKLKLFLDVSQQQQNLSNGRIRKVSVVHQRLKGSREDIPATLRLLRSASTSFLSEISVATNEEDLFQILSNVLADELFSTKNLTDWPCQSFWSAGEPSDPYNLSPDVRRIAAFLSPNCSAPLSNCWVRRDLCESKADGPCAR
jgi:hypothetical protein